MYNLDHYQGYVGNSFDHYWVYPVNRTLHLVTGVTDPYNYLNMVIDITGVPRMDISYYDKVNGTWDYADSTPHPSMVNDWYTYIGGTCTPIDTLTYDLGDGDGGDGDTSSIYVDNLGGGGDDDDDDYPDVGDSYVFTPHLKWVLDHGGVVKGYRNMDTTRSLFVHWGYIKFVIPTPNDPGVVIHVYLPYFTL